MKKETRNEIKFWVIFGLAIAFGSVGMFCPPIGVIDNSVLIYAGELLTFAAAVMGIDLRIDSKIKNRLRKNNDNEEE